MELADGVRLGVSDEAEESAAGAESVVGAAEPSAVAAESVGFVAEVAGAESAGARGLAAGTGVVSGAVLAGAGAVSVVPRRLAAEPVTLLALGSEIKFRGPSTTGSGAWGFCGLLLSLSIS